MDILFGCLIIILVLEFLLRRLYYRFKATKHHGPTHYSWSFVSPQGEAISHLKGDLRLSTHPFTVYSNAPCQKNPKFTINERGIRTDPDLSLSDLPDWQERVIVLGGSTAFGTGLNSNEETYAAHLARMMENVSVLNAGVIGFVSGQEVAQLVCDLVDYHPHLVITLDGFNDLFIQLGKSPVWPGTGANEFDGFVSRLVTFHKIETSMLQGFLNCFRGLGSLLLTTWKIVKHVAGMMLGGHLKGCVKSHLHYLSKMEGEKKLNRMTMENISEQYASNLAKITRMGKGFGFRHLAVMQPLLTTEGMRYDPAGRFHFSKDQIELYERFLKVTMKRLQELNVEYYCAHYDFRTDHAFFLDDIHLTSEGYKALAFSTMRFLQQKEMIYPKSQKDLVYKVWRKGG